MNANEAFGQVTQATHDVEAGTAIIVDQSSNLEQSAAMITNVGEGLDNNELVLAGIVEFADNAGEMWASVTPGHELVAVFAQIENRAKLLVGETQTAGELLDRVVSYILQAKHELEQLADRLNGNKSNLEEIQGLLEQVQ